MPHPPFGCSEQFLGESVCSASPVRGTRVLDGVSSPRPASVDPVPCGGRCWVRSPLPNRPTTRFHDRRPGQQQRGLRRAARERERRRDVATHATTIWFRSDRRLQVVEDARRGIRISVLEDSDVAFVERIAEKRNSDFDQ